MESLGHFFERSMLLGVDEDRALEELSKQHRPNRHVTDHDRGNRQQDQRHSDDPG